MRPHWLPSFFFFNDTATTEIYTLPLHDALPIWPGMEISGLEDEFQLSRALPRLLYVKAPAPDREPRLAELLAGIEAEGSDRKSTRLNSSHSQISYAVFCLKYTITATSTIAGIRT